MYKYEVVITWNGGKQDISVHKTLEGAKEACANMRNGYGDLIEHIEIREKDPVSKS